MSLLVDIRKDFGSFRLAVKMETGDGIACLLGASGSGKSAALKCIAGIERPDEGRIVLNGRTLFDSERHICLPPQKRRVGYLFQNYALFPDMNVRQNILCGLRREKDRAKRERALSEILRIMQLEGLEKHKPAQLSGGQAQRTALARILVSSPELLLLDEPFSALDGYLRDRLKIELRDQLRAFGKEVVMVTHSRDEAYTMSDRIAVIEGGRILAMKPTKELFADPESIGAAKITGCKNIAAAKKTGEHTAYVPDWGISLETAKPLRDDLAAVGIRAHYFHPQTARNRFPVRFEEEMEEPFETVIRFRYEKQTGDSPAVWWRLPKDRRPQNFPEALGIAPVNVLPLYEGAEGEDPR